MAACADDRFKMWGHLIIIPNGTIRNVIPKAYIRVMIGLWLGLRIRVRIRIKNNKTSNYNKCSIRNNEQFPKMFYCWISSLFREWPPVYNIQLTPWELIIGRLVKRIIRNDMDIVFSICTGRCTHLSSYCIISLTP